MEQKTVFVGAIVYSVFSFLGAKKTHVFFLDVIWGAMLPAF